MRPGNVLELKPGLYGLKPPENLGVYLERRKRKKEHLVVVVTLRGVREVRREQITKRRFAVELDVGEGEDALRERLRQLVSDRGEGRLEEETPGAEGGAAWSEEDVWSRLVDVAQGPMRPQELAALLADGEPSKGDVRRLEAVLEKCRRDGVGRFERGDKGRWVPVPRDAVDAFHRTMDACHALRKRLLETRIETDEDGDEVETLVGVHPDSADLDDNERGLLASWAEALASYVLFDRWPDDVLPPGCRVHTLAGRDYHRFLEHFVMDWTGVRGVTRSSAALQFLVDSGRMGVPEAIRLVARRRVRMVPGFAWETPDGIEAWADRYREPAEAAAADGALYAGREDLRDVESYTIDPPDAKDFDDAVALRENEDGSATLWVHIADVSHYVEKDSILDRHARERATSVYLPTGVLPMLPKRLSENLCSLRAGVDRLAMGVRLEVDVEGRVTGATPYQGVIRVARNASYQEVDEAIKADRPPFSRLHALAERMRRHRRGLAIETGELRIRFVEEAAGGLGRLEGVEGESAEAMDRGGDREEGGPSVPDVQPGGVDPAVGLHVQVKHSTPATRMIETFMVAANEAVASFVAGRDVGVPFRCHPLPERAKARRFSAEAKVLGLDVDLDLPEPGPTAEDEETQGPQEEDALLAQLKGGKLQLGGFAASETIGSKKGTGEPDEEEDQTGNAAAKQETPVPLRGFAQLDRAGQDAYLAPFVKALERIEAVQDEAVRGLAYQKLLATLGRALYTPENVGHFGLGSVMYAHFTSPIRRYPDLVLHRQLRWLLEKDAGRAGDAEPPHRKEHLMDFCAHCSGQSQAAERLEWDLLGTCLVFESRREAWSGTLDAMVTGITPGGVFLSLPANLEGLLSMRDIPGGPYEVDEHATIVFRSRHARGAEEDPEEEARLATLRWREMEDPETGELRDVRICLGDRVKVQIRERDLVEGKVRVRLG